MICEIADARNLPVEGVDCWVTSPPYYANRSYGDSDDEIGFGDLSEYYDNMRSCAKSWFERSSETAVAWINLGDTAAGSGGAGGDYNKGGIYESRTKYRQGKVDRQSMQWLNVPHNVAEIFVDEGWRLRSVIVWDKGNRRRESLDHVRRPGISHEYIFMLSRSKKYKFSYEHLPEDERGSVWRIAPSRAANHIAPWPVEIPRRAILCTTNEGDLVVDPFAGSGVTGDIAFDLGRRARVFDLYDAWSNA